MSGATLVMLAAIVGLVVGAALVPGAPIFALPIAAILIVVLGVLELRRRSGEARSTESMREEAKADSIEFTERDKRTLT